MFRLLFCGALRNSIHVISDVGEYSFSYSITMDDAIRPYVRSLYSLIWLFFGWRGRRMWGEWSSKSKVFISSFAVLLFPLSRCWDESPEDCYNKKKCNKWWKQISWPTTECHDFVSLLRLIRNFLGDYHHLRVSGPIYNGRMSIFCEHFMKTFQPERKTAIFKSDIACHGISIFAVERNRLWLSLPRETVQSISTNYSFEKSDGGDARRRKHWVDYLVDTLLCEWPTLAQIGPISLLFVA